MIAKLIYSQWRINKVRLILAVCAMAACSCMLVWMMGSYQKLISSYNEDAQKTLGHYHVVMNLMGKGRMPAVKKLAAFDPSWDEALARHSSVLSTAKAVQLSGYVVSEEKHLANPLSHRERIGIPSAGPMIVGIDAQGSPFEMEEGRWLVPAQEQKEPSADAGGVSLPEAVIGSASAELLGVKVGSCVAATVNAHVYLLRVVGIVEQALASPDIGRDPSKGSGPPLASLYIEKSLADKMAQGGGKSSVLRFVQLKQGVDTGSFCKEWQELTQEYGWHKTQLTTAQIVEERLKNNRGARHEAEQANWALWMSLLSASFIIFTALNIGVDERMREFRVLRCIGMTRGQMVRLIMLESVFLSLIGWLLGLVSALLLLEGFSWGQLSVTLNVQTLVPSVLCAFVGALVASLIPAWRASRVRPLDLPSHGSAGSGRRRLMWLSVVLGALCMLPFALSFFLPHLDVATRLDLFYWVGCPCVAIGMIIWVPFLVVAVEKVASIVLAKILNIPVSLLKLQLSQHLWRSVGTVISLSLGLGLFVAVQTWGTSMLVPFMPNEQLPRALASFLPSGMPRDSKEVMVALQQAVDCEAKDILPAASEQPRIAVEQRTSAAFARLRQDNVVLMGVELQQAFTGEAAFFKFAWLEGDKETSLKEMAQGRACVIPDSLQTATGLKIGDFLMLEGADKHVLSYKVTGVIHIPGWHWLSKRSGMRRNGGFTAALVFADAKQVAQDYPRETTPCFWFNFKEEMSAAQWAEFDQKMQMVARQFTGLSEAGELGAAQAFCHVVTLEGLRQDIGKRASSVIWASCYLPMIAFAITLLAVVNTIIASIRAREREFGVLRALGITRKKLVSLVLAESCIIAWVACSLSLLFGAVTAWGFVSISNYTSYFGAMSPPFVLPWGLLMLSFAITSILCILCAFLPALFLARKEPSQLLEQMKTC